MSRGLCIYVAVAVASEGIPEVELNGAAGTNSWGEGMNNNATIGSTPLYSPAFPTCRVKGNNYATVREVSPLQHRRELCFCVHSASM